MARAYYQIQECHPGSTWERRDNKGFQYLSDALEHRDQLRLEQEHKNTEPRYCYRVIDQHGTVKEWSNERN